MSQRFEPPVLAGGFWQGPLLLARQASLAHGPRQCVIVDCSRNIMSCRYHQYGLQCRSVHLVCYHTSCMKFQHANDGHKFYR